MGILCLALCLLPAVQPVAAIDTDLVGKWTITYTPNGATRTYTINQQGLVMYEDTEMWMGTLLPTKAGEKSSYTLRFDRDGEDRSERLTLCKDGRLMVEHFNPSQQQKPDQIGIGEKSQK
jgi:hypothetical protein